MSKRIWIKVADEGRRVPIEGRPGAYFESGKAHNVRLTPFVQRRIAEGDLVEAPAPDVAPVAVASPATPAPAPAAAEAPIAATPTAKGA